MRYLESWNVVGRELKPSNPDWIVTLPPGTMTTPSGPAGGDLTGTYPDPVIAAGAVGNAEISAVAWNKLTSGTVAASGDLGGTYPSPAIAKLSQQITQFGVRGGLQNDGSQTVLWANEIGQPGYTSGQSTWMVHLNAAGDTFHFYRRPSGGSGALQDMMGINGTGDVYLNYTAGKTYCTLADNRITKPMLGIASTPRTWVAGSIPAVGWTIPGKNAWYNMSSSNVMYSYGGYILSLVYPAWQFLTFATAPQGFWVSANVDNTTTFYQRYHHTASNNVTTPLPGFAVFHGPYAVGNHSFKVDLYCETNSSVAIVDAGATGAIWHIEFN
jgi:hypothetical protein